MTTNCSKCNCVKTQCGCDDRGLTTNPPCATGTPACPNPEPCAETWSDCCVIHNGDSFTYAPNKGGPKVTKSFAVEEPTVQLGFTILQGERMCDTWQRWVSYYECGAGAPYGLKSKNITSSTITIGWTPVTEPIDEYQVFYIDVASYTGSFIAGDTIMPSANPTATITGLNPNTTYYVQVSYTYQDKVSCASVTLILTTKLI